MCYAIDVLKALFCKNFKHKMDLGDILYFYHQKRLLLRNISKIGCQIAGICYNKCVATFWQQKISKP
ncbi:hypothetical protein D7X25_25610 [bacterium 1XD42-8]|nr:hypothetical protein D7X25_25610 [bacterium 1XD42-8]